MTCFSFPWKCSVIQAKSSSVRYLHPTHMWTDTFPISSKNVWKCCQWEHKLASSRFSFRVRHTGTTTGATNCSIVQLRLPRSVQHPPEIPSCPARESLPRSHMRRNPKSVPAMQDFLPRSCGTVQRPRVTLSLSHLPASKRWHATLERSLLPALQRRHDSTSRCKIRSWLELSDTSIICSTSCGKSTSTFCSQIFSEICFCGIKLTILTFASKIWSSGTSTISSTIRSKMRSFTSELLHQSHPRDKYTGDLFHCSLQASDMAWELGGLRRPDTSTNCSSIRCCTRSCNIKRVTSTISPNNWGTVPSTITSKLAVSTFSVISSNSGTSAKSATNCLETCGTVTSTLCSHILLAICTWKFEFVSLWEIRVSACEPGLCIRSPPRQQVLLGLELQSASTRRPVTLGLSLQQASARQLVILGLGLQPASPHWHVALGLSFLCPTADTQFSDSSASLPGQHWLQAPGDQPALSHGAIPCTAGVSTPTSHSLQIFILTLHLNSFFEILPHWHISEKLVNTFGVSCARHSVAIARHHPTPTRNLRTHADTQPSDSVSCQLPCAGTGPPASLCDQHTLQPLRGPAFSHGATACNAGLSTPTAHSLPLFIFALHLRRLFDNFRALACQRKARQYAPVRPTSTPCPGWKPLPPPVSVCSLNTLQKLFLRERLANELLHHLKNWNADDLLGIPLLDFVWDTIFDFTELLFLLRHGNIENLIHGRFDVLPNINLMNPVLRSQVEELVRAVKNVQSKTIPVTDEEFTEDHAAHDIRFYYMLSARLEGEAKDALLNVTRVCWQKWWKRPFLRHSPWNPGHCSSGLEEILNRTIDDSFNTRPLRQKKLLQKSGQQFWSIGRQNTCICIDSSTLSAWTRIRSSKARDRKFLSRFHVCAGNWRCAHACVR